MKSFRNNTRRFIRVTLILIMIGSLVYFFESPAGSKYLAGLSLVSAAVVFGLQNYVASLFSFLYIIFARQYEK